MTTFHLPLDRSSTVPLHRQIYEGVRAAVLEGRLRSGRRMPSSRALARELAVSRLPVLTAYTQLRHEGYLEGRVGSGTFVSAALPDDLLRARSGPSRYVSTRSAPPDAYGGLGPFRMSLPALDAFPHTLWNRLVARHANALTHAQMAYGDPAGWMPLRAAIAEHLRMARAVRCEAEQVLVVAGSQAALRLSAAVLLAPGDRVAMEEPGYPGARAALSAGGAKPVDIPVDEEGLSLAALRARGRRVRVVYVTPSHQYPLGGSMAAARRLALVEWAAGQDAWVLEDDYDSEYRYVSRPLGSLQGMDRRGRVIYVGTFSKVLFPAVRIGFLVVPPQLWSRFMEARRAYDLFPPTLYQSVLAEFLGEGHFVRHLRRMRAVYQARRDALLSGIRRHCGDRLRVLNADAGLHAAVLLEDGLDDADVVARMARRGLTATALSSCYAGKKRRHGLLLGFGGFTERRLAEATRVLGGVLRH